MDLKEYFENNKGIGVLATANSKGAVNTAIYSRPRIQDSESCVFIMTDKLTHKNLQENPHSSYLFKEQDAFQGKRLSLTKIKETDDQAIISQFLRERKTEDKYSNDSEKKLFAVYFKINSTIPLIGEAK